MLVKTLSLDMWISYIMKRENKYFSVVPDLAAYLKGLAKKYIKLLYNSLIYFLQNCLDNIDDEEPQS